MKLQTILTIDVDELGDGFMPEQLDALRSIVRESGAVFVRLTGVVGKYLAFHDYARQELAKQEVTLLR